MNRERMNCELGAIDAEMVGALTLIAVSLLSLANFAQDCRLNGKIDRIEHKIDRQLTPENSPNFNFDHVTPDELAEFKTPTP